MIKKGQSISSVAKKFSVNSDNEESYTKGKATLGTKFETAAAKLKKNQVKRSRRVRRCMSIIKMLNQTTQQRLPSEQIHTASGKNSEAAYEKVTRKWTKRCRQEMG